MEGNNFQDMLFFKILTAAIAPFLYIGQVKKNKKNRISLQEIEMQASYDKTSKKHLKY